MMGNARPVISRMRVEGLFGLYTYELPDRGSLSEAAILYGDNGAGKSTLLRLAFHMLSPANNRGHRTALRDVGYQSFEVELSSGVVLKAQRHAETRALLLTISEGGRVRAFWPFVPKSDRARPGEEGEDEVLEVVTRDGKRLVRRPASIARKLTPEGAEFGEAAYMKALQEVVPVMFILHAERRLESDTIAQEDNLAIHRWDMSELSATLKDVVARSRTNALTKALQDAAKWIQARAVQSANRGSVNVNSVYREVLQHLSAQVQDIAVEPERVESIRRRLLTAQDRTAALAQYELFSSLDAAPFVDALSNIQGANRNMALRVIAPYIDGIEGRLKELNPIYELVHLFVSTLNSFLHDKTVTFALSGGFGISNKLGKELEPAHLSSGEQQLLLLFLYILIAREEPSVFMIDEPEISLNVKWQRRLVQSLLDITSGAQTQLIFASHSMELLGQHRERVVQLTEAQ